MDAEVVLYISIPSNREWKSKFGMCLTYLVAHLTGKGVTTPGYKLHTFRVINHAQASNLPMARQAFVDDMMKGCTVGGVHHDFTHWLSLDDDMTFPDNIVDMLLASGKDVVSCNARHKMETLKGSCQGLDGKPIDSTGKTGIEELLTMGGAIFLAKIDAFRHIPKPHFQMLWSPQHNDYVSEDVHFAALLKANGVRLWACHDTSQKVGHIGDHEYKWPEVEAKKLTAVA